MPVTLNFQGQSIFLTFQGQNMFSLKIIAPAPQNIKWSTQKAQSIFIIQTWEDKNGLLKNTIISIIS